MVALTFSIFSLVTFLLIHEVLGASATIKVIFQYHRLTLFTPSPSVCFSHNFEYFDTHFFGKPSTKGGRDFLLVWGDAGKKGTVFDMKLLLFFSGKVGVSARLGMKPR